MCVGGSQSRVGKEILEVLPVWLGSAHLQEEATYAFEKEIRKVWAVMLIPDVHPRPYPLLMMNMSS
jgi:hypothetical protein